MDAEIIDSGFVHRSQTQDYSNLLVLIPPEDQTVTYYSGFAWEKAGEIETLDGSGIWRRSTPLLRKL